jgi:hypothetical protein
VPILLARNVNVTREVLAENGAGRPHVAVCEAGETEPMDGFVTVASMLARGTDLGLLSLPPTVTCLRRSALICTVSPGQSVTVSGDATTWYWTV